MTSKVNRYILADDVRQKFVPIITNFINEVINCNLEEKSRFDIQIDLTGSELNPYTLGELLEEEFGYEHKETDTNGWQMDFWLTYVCENKPPLCITGCGMTFELILRGEEDDDKDYESEEKENIKLMKLIDEGMEIIRQARALLDEEVE